ncbi:hypothetical protein A0H81_09247 [Grifola frondosa]|uniref:Uncharacterized protein n=1 Tax=Grifola frondosa TaxID=5627 RepID=A0A1C7M304_GRIFR|nr:hypothetical protein A0H81_09247 [Grifola frondosa]
MAGKLAFRLSRGIESTSRPPIPQAYKWAEAYAATPERPLLDMSQGVPGIPRRSHYWTLSGGRRLHLPRVDMYRTSESQLYEAPW